MLNHISVKKLHLKEMFLSSIYVTRNYIDTNEKGIVGLKNQ